MAAPRVTRTSPQKTTSRPGRPSLNKPYQAPRSSAFGGTMGPKASINAPSYKPNPNRQGPAAPGRPGKGWGSAPQPANKPQVAPAANAPQGQHAAPDSLYNSSVDLAEKKGTEALAQLGGQETQIKHDFGIDDPTNPFSRAEGLKRSYLARMKGQSAQLASQGQLYSGAHERALARTRFEQEQAYNQLRDAYNQAMANVNSAKQNVANMTEEEKNNAFAAWLSRAEDTMPEVTPTSDETNSDTAPAPDNAGGGQPGPPKIAAGPPIMNPPNPVTVGQKVAIAGQPVATVIRGANAQTGQQATTTRAATKVKPKEKVKIRPSNQARGGRTTTRSRGRSRY